MTADHDTVEAGLRERLARCDGVSASMIPVLRHLVRADDRGAALSDETVARVRGMIAHLARELLGSPGADAGAADETELAAALMDDPALLLHVQALALEAQLAQRLQSTLAIDPVLPPLLQAVIADADEARAGPGMRLLAAQARFMQAQRRMEIGLTELPGELLHRALLTMRTVVGTDGEPGERVATTARRISAEYDAGASRLGLAARLVRALDGDAAMALSLADAGVTIFLTALSLACGQEREAATLATGEGPAIRLGLMLRASGLTPALVEQQLLALHPEGGLPDNKLSGALERVSPDTAAAILMDAARIGAAHPDR